MEILLAFFAFWLGACPLSLWVGKWLLGKDIRDYGDGNPGAMNVFRAGGRKSFFLAVILDAVKGMPFVILAYSLFEFTDAIVMAIALCAILGHAFSPFLRLRGGKSISVTFGALLVLPQHQIIASFAIFMFLGFLLIDIDAWIVMFGTVGSLVYLLATTRSSWESLFMLCVLAVLAIKHFDDLKTLPRLRGRLIRWLRPAKRQA